MADEGAHQPVPQPAHLGAGAARDLCGQWLPEPLLAGDPMLGPADTAEQRESVSYAVLTLMERLSPNERAVYVLREAFGYPHREIAEILDITEAASQQIYRRAKQHVADGRARTEVDEAAARRIVEEFLAAATSGRDRAAGAAAHRRTPSRSATAAGRSRPAPRRSRERSRSRSSCGACSSPARPSAPWSAARPRSTPGPPTASPPSWSSSTAGSSASCAWRSPPRASPRVRTQVNPDKLERATARWAAADHGEPLFTASDVM